MPKRSPTVRIRIRTAGGEEEDVLFVREPAVAPNWMGGGGGGGG